MNFYSSLAATVLMAHLTWIAWVIFGCLVTRHRPFLRGLHIASLIYGIVIELGPWPCPLTIAEESLMSKAGATPYREGFLIHYLQALVYPDVSQELLTWGGIAVCLVNLGVYALLFWRAARARFARVRPYDL